MKKYLRVSEAAELLGITATTLRKWDREGKLVASRNMAGQRVYDQENLHQLAPENTFSGSVRECVVRGYMRSSSGNAQLKESQKQAILQAYPDCSKFYSDNGSGLNENRVGLSRLLKDAKNKEYTHLVVTNEDRLSRFGVAYLRAYLELCGVELIVLGKRQNLSAEDELMSDFMALIASFSGKFYRLRSKENQQKLLKKAAQNLD